MGSFLMVSHHNNRGIRFLRKTRPIKIGTRTVTHFIQFLGYYFDYFETTHLFFK